MKVHDRNKLRHWPPVSGAEGRSPWAAPHLDGFKKEPRVLQSLIALTQKRGTTRQRSVRALVNSPPGRPFCASACVKKEGSVDGLYRVKQRVQTWIRASKQTRRHVKKINK